MSDPTGRFSSRVAAYLRYRPRYPAALVPLLERECGLTPDAVIADLGSGTGFLAQLFLENGNRVFGVEPNREMREAGKHLLARFAAFTSVDGRAEDTTLADSGVDLVTAGQAFHWFDRTTARREFARILRPPRWVVLVWNVRRKTATSFLRAYERLLLEYSIDYRAVDHSNVTDEMIAEFYRPGRFTVRSFENPQVFDYEGLEGRLMSSSYVPEPGHPDHVPMLTALRAVFDEHQVGGTLCFEHDTRVYIGRLDPA